MKLLSPFLAQDDALRGVVEIFTRCLTMMEMMMTSYERDLYIDNHLSIVGAIELKIISYRPGPLILYDICLSGRFLLPSVGSSESENP